MVSLATTGCAIKAPPAKTREPHHLGLSPSPPFFSQGLGRRNITLSRDHFFCLPTPSPYPTRLTHFVIITKLPTESTIESTIEFTIELTIEFPSNQLPSSFTHLSEISPSENLLFSPPYCYTLNYETRNQTLAFSGKRTF